MQETSPTLHSLKRWHLGSYKTTQTKLYSQLASLAAPVRWHLAAILALNLVSTPIALLGPLPLKIAVDSIFGQQAVPTWLSSILPITVTSSISGKLAVVTGLLLAVSIIASIQSLAAWLLQTYVGEVVVHEFRARLLWHVQQLSLAYHDRRGASDIAYRIQYDAPSVQYILIQGVLPLISAAFAFFAMLYVTSRISPKLAAIALLLSPVLFLLSRKSSSTVRVGAHQVRELDSSAMLVLSEALYSVRAVKAFGQEAWEEQRFRRKSRQRMSEQLRLASVQASFHVLMGLTIALGTAMALWIGVTQVVQGVITVGELVLVMAYISQLYSPLQIISSKIPELQGWLASAQRAFSLLDETPETVTSSGSVTPASIRGAISASNVSFRYATGPEVLSDVSFGIPAGSRVGIIGPSGSGKSTLINLLTRFYDPTSGSISMDGVDLRDYKLTALREQFSIVLQDPHLFSTTVAGNIAYGRPDAPRSEIIAAAEAAMADEFIHRLPDGYDTRIGEGAARLSGGERQRIAIARAILKNSPVLILDEPTSAIDVAAEQLILKATENLTRGRTSFMIAHRLTTVRDCDLLLVLKHGRLVLLTPDYEEAIRALQSADVSV